MSDGFSQSWVERVHDVIVRDDLSAVDGAWIVICTDPVTGFTSYSGPYAGGPAALAAIDWELGHQEAWPVEERLRFTPARLGGPQALGQVADPGSGGAAGAAR